MRLGEEMVKDGLITSEVLARALERQIIFGGRLGTNLVEMGAITEEGLAKFLSKTLRVSYAEPEKFEDVPQEVIDCIPAELAQKYTIFPIIKERGRLHLAMKDPNDMMALDELRFIVGLDIRPYIASEMRIVFALEKYYGIKRDLRYVSVAGMDKQHDAPAATAPPVSSAPPTAHLHEEYLGDESQMESYTTAPPPQFDAPPAPSYAPPPPAPPVVQAPVYVPPAPVYAPPPQPAMPPAAAAPPESPYDILAAPLDREQVASAMVAAATQELKRAAVLLVKGDMLTGWRCSGPGLADEMVASVSVSLSAPSIFKEVVEDKRFYKGPILQVPQNTQLLVALGGAYPQEAIAYPLIIKGKVVAVLYGDNGQGALVTGDIGKLTRLMTKASMSIEILILKNKILTDV